MTLLGIDLGTTHCKAGLFDLNGRALYVASWDNLVLHDPRGFAYYAPQEIWVRVMELIREVMEWQRNSGCGVVQAIGIASMAESGLLVDQITGQARSVMLPWFDPLATAQADYLRERFGVKERFLASGLRLSFKCSLAKILWLRQQDAAALDGTVWLSAADYIAYQLSGALGTDASLGVRTGALRIDNLSVSDPSCTPFIDPAAVQLRQDHGDQGRAWDQEFLSALGLDASLFPPLLPAGMPLGGLRNEWVLPGLPAGTPVAVCGHDHICAAFAAEALLGDGHALDSMGTAESLVGALAARRLGEVEWHSGFSFGCHVHPGKLYWASGLSTSGGAVEWLRGILGDPPLGYAELDALLALAPDMPGDVIFLPYLAGSGAPHNDPKARGAFIGLEAAHSRADLYRAVLEGTTFEMEYARQKAGALTGIPVTQLAVAGGGTRNRRWLQIKADVSGCPVAVLPEAQATALGAALLAGLGSGVYAGWESLSRQVQRTPEALYQPDAARHEIYLERYTRFLCLL